MKYIRTEDGVYPNEYPYQIDKRECLYEITCRIPFSTIEHGKVIKQADTIRGLIMKGDLVFAKDGYAGINATEHPSIAIDDIDKCTQYFEKHITKFYIELSNGDYRLAAKEKRGDLELL